MLWRENAVRLIYTDEAGTSPAEPVRVVAGIIIHGDNQLRDVTTEIARLIKDRVPEIYREDFVFHGKEVFNGGKYFNSSEWTFDDRVDFFKEFICIPRVYDLPISLGVVWKGAFDHTVCAQIPINTKNKVRMHQIEHLIAFQYCLERADKFLRKYLNGEENGAVFAEDAPEMRKLLAGAGMSFRDNPLFMPSECLANESWQQTIGMVPEAITYEINHLIDVPHFVEKSGASILQLADACAFAFRRSLSRQAHGDDLVLAMLGPQAGTRFVTDPVWLVNTSSSLFNTEAYWSETHREEGRKNYVDFLRATILGKSLPL